ncbi:hypothetical protein BC940DRAFT_316103, partial [Gongronella butleri]
VDLLRFLGVFGKQAAGVDFRIPTSKATLFKWTGFDTIHDKSKTLYLCKTCVTWYDADKKKWAPDGTCIKKTFGGLLCGEQLFESDQKTPKQVFFYEPLTVSIARMMIRPGFEQMINAWRNMPGDLGKWDVCHGNLWKNVPDPDYPPPGAFETGTPLIGDPLALSLVLNVDWLQPHEVLVSCFWPSTTSRVHTGTKETTSSLLESSQVLKSRQKKK